MDPQHVERMFTCSYSVSHSYPHRLLTVQFLFFQPGVIVWQGNRIVTADQYRLECSFMCTGKQCRFKSYSSPGWNKNLWCQMSRRARVGKLYRGSVPDSALTCGVCHVREVCGWGDWNGRQCILRNGRLWATRRLSCHQHHRRVCWGGMVRGYHSRLHMGLKTLKYTTLGVYKHVSHHDVWW